MLDAGGQPPSVKVIQLPIEHETSRCRLGFADFIIMPLPRRRRLIVPICRWSCDRALSLAGGTLILSPSVQILAYDITVLGDPKKLNSASPAHTSRVYKVAGRCLCGDRPRKLLASNK